MSREISQGRQDHFELRLEKTDPNGQSLERDQWVRLSAETFTFYEQCILFFARFEPFWRSPFLWAAHLESINVQAYYQSHFFFLDLKKFCIALIWLDQVVSHLLAISGWVCIFKDWKEDNNCSKGMNQLLCFNHVKLPSSTSALCPRLWRKNEWRHCEASDAGPPILDPGSYFPRGTRTHYQVQN